MSVVLGCRTRVGFGFDQVQVQGIVLFSVTNRQTEHT